MREYQKLLVVADPTAQQQVALTRAIELASINRAEITVFLSIFDFSYEMTSILSSHERETMRQGVVDQRLAWVNDLIKQHSDSNVSMTAKVIWHNRPYESIIEEAIAGNYDLVVKATHEHDKLKSVIFTPTDWHLLRKCPAPVLLAKEEQWPIAGKIICAVNVATEDDEHESLNTKIIQHAKALAEKFNIEIHLVNGFPATPVNLSIELPDFDARSYNETVRMQHEERVYYLADTFGIPTTQCHIKEGLPEDVIPEIAQELDAKLVILGTIGRTGISAALIGNTAEHVIDNINCDLLALKPAGYISPLQQQA
ncbi:universal stress protein UspE [Shewanella marina]|uniref:universal stress protein UspE n=1 Tax=Shewanella marina TaxID=487319 RepID=UPI0004715B87|nr:universal stress protein UspE [Shewanella marina]